MQPLALGIFENASDALWVAVMVLVVILWAIRVMFHLVRDSTRAVLARVRADESFDR